MSDQDREKLAQGTEDAEQTPEDVEAHVKARGANDEIDDEVRAHVKGGRLANDEADEEVRAHVKGGRLANDDDSGDDVEAHVKAGR
jgi:hypothetical protein